MPKPTLATFGSDVKNFRRSKTLREAAEDIGISAPTLMRVESGRIPDVETFGKICAWMGVEPGRYLGVVSVGSTTGTSGPSAVANGALSASGTTQISAHFRADQNPRPETAQALARMIMHAASRQKPTDSVDGT